MFPNLFAPIQVGPKRFRNRIVSSANFTGLSEHHMPSERFANYHVEKVKGGVALTVVEELPVSATTRFALPRSIFAYDAESIPGFKLMTERVHEFGALASAQLVHRGAHQYGFDPGGMAVKIAGAPSQVPSLVAPDGYSVPYEMNPNEIESEARNYSKTSLNLIEAGFDGVEIKCDASSLPIQFLSPLTNKRDDEYGGSFQNRLRFLELIVTEIYAVTNGKVLLGIKMPGSEFVRGGLTLEDTKKIAQRLNATGKVDYIAVGGGNLGFDPDYNTPSAYYPQGLFVNLAEGIRKSVNSNMKVMTLGRIIEPAFADSIIADGKADLVIMMRALIADPELPHKAMEGRVSEIIPCIGCNQGCLGHVLQDRNTSCILNPVIGREKEWGSGTMSKSDEPKHVVIVGAGPAGLECARISAMRGHQVTLLEQSHEIGGQARVTSSLPGRTDVSRAITFWADELSRLGVTTMLGFRATPAEVMKMNLDMVVCATGAVRRREKAYSPAFSAPSGTEFIRETEELASLKSGERDGMNSVIYDDRGDFQALGWAELSALSGARTTLVTRNPMVGAYVDSWTRFTASKRLGKLGVKLISDAFPSSITRQHVTCFNIYAGEEASFSLDSDFTYFISWPVSNDSLFTDLVAAHGSSKIRVASIGDCRSPRSLEEAIFEGYELGRNL